MLQKPDNLLASIYLIKIDHKNFIKICKICSELTIKISERLSGIANFEEISHIFPVSPMLTLGK